MARVSIAIGCAVALGSGVIGLAARAAAGPVIATIDSIDREQIYEQRFTLPAETEVEIEAVCSGWLEEKSLFAYPWILDLRARRVAWTMSLADARETSTEHNLAVNTRSHLPAGDYALYFSATGGLFPIRKRIKVFGVFELGSVAIAGRFPVKWDEYGDPRKWRATVRAIDPHYRPVPPPPRIEPDCLVRIAPVTDLSFRRAALDVTSPVRLRVLAIGEYAGSGRGFADGAWIVNRDLCERVWEMTLENTVPAGGAEKNRLYDGEITIEPGRYMLCYGSDDSHAFNEWNSSPPFDPESWGVTFFQVREVPPGAVHVEQDPPIENLVVKLAPIGDRAFVQKGFTLDHAADFCVRALGEQLHKEDRMIDFGWIENAETRETVWSMEAKTGAFAGGEQRNRLVEERVHLEPGSYWVGYATDDSHSPDAWRDHPPFDPQGWGIQVCGLGKNFSRAWIRDFDPRSLDRAIISITPVRDDETRRVDFAVTSPTRARIIALGEGSDDEMYDYGWLTRGETDETVWRMEYKNTVGAGGARKNRKIDVTVQLAPGRYALHYRTDGSHAFGDWNAESPNEPYRWGVTLVETPAAQ